MIITRTPFRLSFFGGGTDYNPWYEENSGLVLATGLGYYCYLTVRHLPPFFEDHTSRVVYSKIESVFDHSEINKKLKNEKIDVTLPGRTFFTGKILSLIHI